MSGGKLIELPTRRDTAVRALGRLVGTWDLGGEASGTVTYRWLPGEHFLEQYGEMELFGHRTGFTEIIGRLRRSGGEPAAEITSWTFTAEGDTLEHVYELDGDTLTIWDGRRGSDCCFVGTFGARGDTLTGAWTWPGGRFRVVSVRRAA